MVCSPLKGHAVARSSDAHSCFVEIVEVDEGAVEAVEVAGYTSHPAAAGAYRSVHMASAVSVGVQGLAMPVLGKLTQEMPTVLLGQSGAIR